MKPTILLLTGLTLMRLTVLAQAPSIQWAKTYGGFGADVAHSIQQTADHGFIVAGWSESNDGDVTGHHGPLYEADAWITKLDSTGKLEWERSYGGSSWDDATSIRITSDGGYIFAGKSYSNDGDVSGHHGSTGYCDVWVVKLDAKGNIQWERSYGGSSAEVPGDIQQTTDGGYVVAAGSWSTDGDVTGHHGNDINWDYWIFKLSSSGDMEWENCFGGSSQEEPCSIFQLKNGDYFIAGYSLSNDGDVTGHHGSLKNADVWIMELTPSGKFIGGESLPNNESQTPESVCLSRRGAYIIAGIGGGFPHHGIATYGEGDLMLLKVSKRGILDTACAMGGSEEDNAFSVAPANDGGYIVGGQTFSKDHDVTGNHGDGDYWVVKVDSNLKLEWEEALGGINADVDWAILQTDDAGYIAAGQADSNDGDVTGSHGSADFWIVKLAPDHIADEVTSNTEAAALKSTSDQSNFSLLMNPVNSQLTANYSSEIPVMIQLIDLTGKPVASQSLQPGSGNISFDVSGIRPGIYFLQFHSENENLTKKVEIIH